MRQLVAWNSDQAPLIPADQNYIAHLTMAYVRKKKAVLVFCSMKKLCEQMAHHIASKLPLQFEEYAKVPSPGLGGKLVAPKLEFTEISQELRDIVSQVVEHIQQSNGHGKSRSTVYDKSLQKKREYMVEELRSCPSGLCPVLE